MNGSSKPDVPLSLHSAPEYPGPCQWCSPDRYQPGPLGKCTLGATGFHYAKDVCHKALAFFKHPCLPEDPPSVSLSPALPGAFASEGILPAEASGWLPTQSKLRASSGLLRSLA
jgi:hypothetical protein